MCEICRISGQNIFSGTDHNVDEDFEDLEPYVPESYYVWRRGDSFVGITNVDPNEVFTDEYTYHVLLVTTNAGQAYYEATIARSCN